MRIVNHEDGDFLEFDSSDEDQCLLTNFQKHMEAERPLIAMCDVAKAAVQNADRALTIAVRELELHRAKTHEARWTPIQAAVKPLWNKDAEMLITYHWPTQKFLVEAVHGNTKGPMAEVLAKAQRLVGQLKGHRPRAGECADCEDREGCEDPSRE